MKKMILVMALATLVVLGAFAEITAGTFELSTTITPIDTLVYSLKASSSGNEGSYGDSITGLSLTESGTVFFQILDESKYNLQSVKNVTIKVTQNGFGFVLNDENGVISNPEAEEHVASSIENSTKSDKSTDVALATGWTVTYEKGKLVDYTSTASVVGYFEVSWTGVPDLGAGKYSNTITLNVTSD